MDLTRRQIAIIFAGLYCAGGVLLLSDYLADHSAPGAHLPLAWHVFPVSVVVTIIALLLDSSAPLDPIWYVPVAAIIGGFLAANCLCAISLFKIVGGRRSSSAENNATPSALPEN